MKKDCGWKYYSFAHELAHSFGCDHDFKWYENKTNPYFPFGHGYRMHEGPPGKETAGYNSIMAKLDYVHTRENYYSNPRILFIASSLFLVDKCPTFIVTMGVSATKFHFFPGMRHCFPKKFGLKGTIFTKNSQKIRDK